MRCEILCRLLVFAFGWGAQLAAQAPSPIVFSPAATITVETSQGDPVLSCKQLQNLASHMNNQSAFQNLLGVPLGSVGEAFVVGHGEPGGLCTGDGRACYTAEKSVNLYDEQYWSQYADGIKGRFSRLSLLGCNIGRFKDGSDFLAKMADVVKMSVRAPNGMVWCINDQVVLDPEVAWVEVKSGSSPPVDNGRAYTLVAQNEYALTIDGQKKRIPAASIEILEFQYFGLPLQRSFIASPFEAIQLLTLIDFGTPFPHKGRPLAAITGKIRLAISQDGRPRLEKRYFLYADDIVQEVDSPEPVFYRTDSRIHQKLQEFLDLHMRAIR